MVDIGENIAKMCIDALRRFIHQEDKTQTNQKRVILSSSVLMSVYNQSSVYSHLFF